MLKKLIYDELLHANENLNTIEARFYEVTNHLIEAEMDLEFKKAELINSSMMNKDNEDQQGAQLMLHLKGEYMQCKKLGIELNALKANYNSAQRTFDMWKKMMESQ
ncbi:MAG TPA: hypothetical protein DDY49_15190 [Paenibacillaceae bacterium]|nr:hypothetical protein [Paenibacillaceae bacterium]